MKTHTKHPVHESIYGGQVHFPRKNVSARLRDHRLKQFLKREDSLRKTVERGTTTTECFEAKTRRKAIV